MWAKVKSRVARFLKNVVYGLLVCVIFFMALELALYAAGIDHRHCNLKLQNKYHPIANAPELPTSFQGQVSETVWHNVIHNKLCYPDVDYIFKVTGNPGGLPVNDYEGINSLGFRGEEFDFNTQDKRMVILGNSCVFGWGLYKYEDTFTYQLEEKLRDKGEHYEVFNLGQPGYSSTQCLKLFNEWKTRINPDLLVIYLGWNDIWPTPLLSDSQTMKALKVNNTWAARQLRKMRTYALMKDVFADSENQSVSTTKDTVGFTRIRVPFDEGVSNLKNLSRHCRTIIVLPPYCQVERKGIESFRTEVLQKLSEKAAIVKLDSMEITSPNSASYFSGDGFHPNEKGAEYIAERLVQEIWFGE